MTCAEFKTGLLVFESTAARAEAMHRRAGTWNANPALVRDTVEELTFRNALTIDAEAARELKRLKSVPEYRVIELGCLRSFGEGVSAKTFDSLIAEIYDRLGVDFLNRPLTELATALTSLRSHQRDESEASNTPLSVESQEHLRREECQASLKLFVSYSHADEVFLEPLKSQLQPAVRRGEISIWCDRELLPGTQIHRSIEGQIDQADVLVFLLSPDFLRSEYCVRRELMRGVERAVQGSACLIGVVVRPCQWKAEFPSDLLVLPRDARPVTKWGNRDEAWMVVGQELERVLVDLRSRAKPWGHVIPDQI